MLYFDAVKPATLEVLRLVSRFPEFKKYFLVGGTALTLHIGHRISEDIDLFTLEDFDSENLYIILKQKLTITDYKYSHNTLRFWVNDIKVELLTYSYPLLDQILVSDAIRLLSIKDIIPMKLSAIESRGSKKDFFDFYFLHNFFPLKDMLQLYSQKFNHKNTQNILKALSYFDDAENEPNPIMLQPLSWDKVKATIVSIIKNYK